MSKAGCHTVNIEGMRVPTDHVMIELRLPGASRHAGEIGDPGFRITQSDIDGLPRAEDPKDWNNTEASLRNLLGPEEYDRLTDFEKAVLLRGTPLGHGRYTFFLSVETSGDTGWPDVTVAELKKLGRFSPRAHVYAGPISADRVYPTYGTDGEQLDYRSVLGASVAFDAKRARGSAGRSGKRPGPVWDNARNNPDALMMLLDGISPGSSENAVRIKGTRRANAAQMAWILQSPGAAQCVSEVLLDAKEALEYWVTETDVARWEETMAEGVDPRHFENGFERMDAQDMILDRALRLIRGFVDLAEEEPDILTDFLAQHPIDVGPTLPSMAVALGYITPLQHDALREEFEETYDPLAS